MDCKRRDFIGALAATGAMSAFLKTPAAAEALNAAFDEDQDQGASTADLPSNSENFWANYYNGHLTGERALGRKNPPKDDSQGQQINFLAYDDKSHALRFAHEIKPEELPPIVGDVAVNVKVGGMRLAEEDREALQKLQAAQLRVDLVQNKSMLAMIDKLAWASVAALHLSQGKLPSLQDLSFTPESTQSVILPNGTGAFGVNVTATPHGSKLFQIFQTIVKEVDRFAPAIGLPAISLNALNAFNTFYGAIEQRTRFLFRMVPQQINLTYKEGEDNSKLGINMQPGDYVLVPDKHVKLVQDKLDQFKLMQGYLVPADFNGKASVYQTAMSTPPPFSYMTVNLGVSELKSGTPATKPSSESGGSSSGAKKSTPSKPAAGAGAGKPAGTGTGTHSGSGTGTAQPKKPPL